VHLASLVSLFVADFPSLFEQMTFCMYNISVSSSSSFFCGSNLTILAASDCLFVVVVLYISCKSRL